MVISMQHFLVLTDGLETIALKIFGCQKIVGRSFFSENFCPFGAENIFLENLEVKLKFGSSIIFSVGNLQCVKKVCNFLPTYF